MLTNEAPPQTPCCGTVSLLSVGLLRQSNPCYLDISCGAASASAEKSAHICHLQLPTALSTGAYLHKWFCELKKFNFLLVLLFYTYIVDI